MRPSLATILTIIVCAAASPVQAQPSEMATPEATGRTDRLTFEAWFGKLNGDQRRGAEFWVQERSKPRPVSCFATEGSTVPAFIEGCTEAQRRLALPDVRRRIEVDYRKGWNAKVEAADLGRIDQTPTAIVGQSRINQEEQQSAERVAQQERVNRNEFKQTDIISLKLDAGRIAATKVEVSGWMNTFGDHWFLSAMRDGGARIYVDILDLSREERRDLMAHCDPRRCPVVIRGTVAKVDFGEWGVRADMAQLAPTP